MTPAGDRGTSRPLAARQRPARSKEAPSREAPSREAPSREAPSREAPSQETEVEPVIDDPAGTIVTPTDVAVAIPRAPTDSPYSPAQDRERMRMWLGAGILGATGVFGLLVAAAVLSDADNADALLTGVFTPLVGLSGAVLGFYFGGKDPKA